MKNFFNYLFNPKVLIRNNENGYFAEFREKDNLFYCDKEKGLILPFREARKAIKKLKRLSGGKYEIVYL